MKTVLKIFSMILGTAGLCLLALGWSRYRLLYENQRYFDPQTEVIYHQQAAEVYLIVGIVLTIVGLVLTVVSFRAPSLVSR